MLVYALSLVTLLSLCACTSNPEKRSETVLSKDQDANYNLTSEIATFDPRKCQGLNTSNLIYMLFEGLVKTDKDANLILASAEKIAVSADLKTYTFILKDTMWSNGDPLRAQDFEYSFKSQLNPDLKATHSYMLEVIKGARHAMRSGNVDEVAVYAEDDRTLKVELENPTPYFLQMCASPAFFPVNKKWTEEHPDFKINDQRACVSNGPFSLVSYRPQECLRLRKSVHYWNNASVKLNTICCTFLDDADAYAKFQNGTLDWIGNPFSTLSSQQIKELQSSNRLISTPAACTQFLRINCTKAPFTSAKMRRAFASCINLKEILYKAMDRDEEIATNFVPRCLGLSKKEYFKVHDLDLARKLYEEALAESGLTKESLPLITLNYLGTERTRLIVGLIKENIKEAFDLDIELQELAIAPFSQKLFTKDYSLALSTWVADYLDPTSFLNIFATDSNGINNTGWTNKKYNELLTTACVEMDTDKRFGLLEDAEDILMQDMPVIPLFHFSYTYATSDDLKGDVLSPLGIVDVTTAFRIRSLDAVNKNAK